MTIARSRRQAGHAYRQAGFTLIEILVVLGIIAILAAIVIIAINPAKQFAQARNAQRQSNINAILNAIGQRISDNKGTFSGSFSIGSGASALNYTCPDISVLTAATPIYVTGSAGAGVTAGTVPTCTSTSCDLYCLVPTYIAIMPFDPQATTITNTTYTLSQDSTGRIQICAPNAANETSVPGAATICVKR